MLGIIGAMEVEVAKLKERMEHVEVTEKAGMHFYKGILNGGEVVVVQAGIGKVNAAACTQCLIDTYQPDYVINTGIGGSLNAEINICDVVLSTDAIEHDMDATIFDYPYGHVPGMDVLAFEADEKLRAIAKEACEKVNPHIGVFEGRIVSGDQFISSKEKKEWLVNTFHGFCTEMEGASIAHVAHINKVPFLIIREISDKADESAQMDYPTFEKNAIECSVRLVYELAGRMK
ncbi:MAG: 5'-methylthioadenosine/adenosylhomocysteine nucleosidase [Lachnospiraceae bacterium]|nr:5'-methylthioadenosine/adenosylhomocysteine nucleosidase [Lachnospiraceae bacterium]